MTSTFSPSLKQPLKWSRAERIVLFSASLMLGLLLFTTIAVALSLERDGVFIKEWITFYKAGQLVLEGRLTEVYRNFSFYWGFPYFYPPFLLYLCALLALVPMEFVHLTQILFSFFVLSAALCLLKRFLGSSRQQWLLVCLVIFSMGSWWGLLVIGQIAQIHVLLISICFILWKRKALFGSGFFMAFLLAKPNIGIVFWILCLLQRNTRALLGLLSGFIFLFAVTIPLGGSFAGGVELWSDFFSALGHHSEVFRFRFDSMFKHQTLFAFIWAIMGREASFGALHLCWGFFVFILGVLLLCCWRLKASEKTLPRLLSIAVLFVVAGNPYLFFYDGILLLIPAAVWYCDKQSYRNNALYTLIGLCVAGIYVSQLAILLVFEWFPPLVGLFASVWLLAEELDFLLPKTLSNKESL